MVQSRGHRRREDRAGPHPRPEEGRRLGDRRVPAQQGDPVGPLAKALEALLATNPGGDLFPDPVVFPRRYRSRPDIEASAFIAASFAFGNAARICAFLERLFAVLSPSPHAAVAGAAALPHGRTAGLRYRFVSPAGVRRFLACLGAAYREKGTLENLYAEGAGIPGAGPKERLASFLGWFRERWGPGLPRERNFLFPDPRHGSACKRHNLFLRWMVRGDDGVDLGTWSVVSPRDLIVPLDTHVARMGAWLGLTARRSADWKTAEEITEALRAVRPGDPVMFDFALARIGILGACTRLRRGACGRCPLAPACAASRN